MLLGSFFTLSSAQRNEQHIRAVAEFNPQHEIFKGHFPGLPVVPGVCQMQMLTETLSEVLGRPIEVKRLQHMKFLALLNPTKAKQIKLDIKIEKEEGPVMLVSALYSNSEESFFRFKGELH